MVAAVKYENILMNIYELIIETKQEKWSASELEEKRGVTGELILKIEKDMTRPSELTKTIIR